jgi:hypothetical protein
MLARNKLLFAVLLSAVLVSVAAYAAKAPVNPDEPITMTKGMYADLVCMAAGQFNASTGGVEFAYDPAANTVRATCLEATMTGTDNPKYAEQNRAIRKAYAKALADSKSRLLMSQIQRHVSPDATSVFVGF